jgi:hypothetical protein
MVLLQGGMLGAFQLGSIATRCSMLRALQVESLSIATRCWALLTCILAGSMQSVQVLHSLVALVSQRHTGRVPGHVCRCGD